ncbi:MAG: hypothetical protein JRN11_06425 [Nitrososphaerota archaeon]|nr:hypothetical protein [Nitrososphaerota archaeon]
MTLSGEAVEALDSWRSFANALPDEDRARFARMVQKCHEYSSAMCAGDPVFPDEALIMCLLLVQHNAIARLAGLAKARAGNDSRLDI